jgi:hypothetical protein
MECDEVLDSEIEENKELDMAIRRWRCLNDPNYYDSIRQQLQELETRLQTYEDSNKVIYQNKQKQLNLSE